MEKYLKAHFKFEAMVTTIAYAATAISLLADVIGRELFDKGIWGAPRFAVYSAIIAGFLGMSLASASGGHLRPQVLDFVVPAPLDQVMNRVADFISGLLYLGLTYLSINFVMETYQNQDTAPVLDWLIWPIQLVLPYAFLSSAFHFFVTGFNPRLKDILHIGEVKQ